MIHFRMQTMFASLSSFICTRGLGSQKSDRQRIKQNTMSSDACFSDEGNDIWGWTDPENGDEYVIMGLNFGTSFVRITDPQNPVVVGYLPTK